MYAVNLLARKMVRPSVNDWNLFKRVLRYLKGTADMKLSYQKKAFSIEGFSDASYAEEPGRKSMSGYVYVVNGDALTSKSQRQSIVALSTMESEYIGLANALKEGQWLIYILEEFFPGKSFLPLKVFEDNLSCKKLSENPILNDRSKHIDVRLHFIRDLIDGKVFEVIQVSNDWQVADIFTKSLLPFKFERFRKLMGLSKGQGSKLI